MNEKCIDKQVKVMLLGTFHMENPGRDVIRPEVDDVLSPKRQKEISALIKSLAKWEPEIIAVEFPYEKQDELNALYKNYIQNPTAFEDSHLSPRNEIVQIGFRLAKHLNHEKLLAVDWFPEFPEWITKEDFEDVMYFTPEMRLWDRKQIELEEKNKLEKLTIAQYLYWLNLKPRINTNDTIMIDISLEHKNKKVAFTIASNWFERNLGIVRNLKEILPGGIKRVLLLYGAGHIPMLNYIMEMSSIFCPVSPLPYLKEEIMKVPNLDYKAALTAQKIVEGAKQNNAPKDIENTVTKALGILQAQGVYALYLYLYSQAEGNNPAAYLLRLLWNELKDEEVSVPLPEKVKVVLLQKNKILFCEPRKFGNLVNLTSKKKEEMEQKIREANDCVEQVKNYSKLWIENKDKFDSIANIPDIENLDLKYEISQDTKSQKWQIQANNLYLHKQFTQLPSVREIILTNIRELTADLDTLLLVRDLYEQTLIYARFHAKAAQNK